MDTFAIGQIAYKSLSGLRGGDEKAFTNNADTDEMPLGAVAARAMKTKVAMEEYATPNKDGSYKTALPIPEEGITDEMLERESKRLGRRDINGFDALDEHARRFNQEDILAADLINGLMHPNPELRPTAKQALSHPWFTRFPVDREQAVKTITRVLNK